MALLLLPWLLFPTGLARTASAQIGPLSKWQKLGGYTFDAGLASPAGGPVSAVWFSPDGATLYARTSAGALWQSSDLENWLPAASASPHPAALPRQSAPTLPAPEPGAKLVSAPGGDLYALGSNLFRSDDGGRTWANLTGFNGRSIIGPGQNELAVSPSDAQTIAVANAWGVWLSHDAGLSWIGLNDSLPNLKIDDIVSAGGGVTGGIAGVGQVALSPGDMLWRPAGAAAGLPNLSAVLGASITAFASAGENAYAGSSDGRLWTSRDRMATWTLSASLAGGTVRRIFADPAVPGAAFAVSAGRSRTLLRTIDGGQFWDDITGNLADNPARAIVADRAAGAIYAATDRGVFLARADLNALGPVPAWTAVPGLPDRPVLDVKLAGTRIYASVDGYGVYSRSTPKLTGAVRLVSSADLSERAAAPGALLSVLGQRIASASAGNLKIPILAAGDEESQIQVPFEATGPQLSLTLDQRTMAVALKAASPAIFLDKEGAPMLLDAETGLVLEARAGLRPRMRIQVLATGLGRTNPAWPTAMPAPADNPPAVASFFQVWIGGNPVEITKATLAPGYVGLYLVELTLPPIVDAGPAELFLSAAGEESNRVRIFLQN